MARASKVSGGDGKNAKAPSGMRGTSQATQIVGLDEDMQRQRAQLAKGRQETVHALGLRVHGAHAQRPQPHVGVGLSGAAALLFLVLAQQLECVAVNPSRSCAVDSSPWSAKRR